jgi:hypothetical protein
MNWPIASWLSLTITKYLKNQLKERKGLFWLTVLEWSIGPVARQHTVTRNVWRRKAIHLIVGMGKERRRKNWRYISYFKGIMPHDLKTFH